MTAGPGKYDAACTIARENTGALACILIVLGGQDGSGFSVQAVTDEAFAATLRQLPKLLRGVADDIESDMKKPDTQASG